VVVLGLQQSAYAVNESDQLVTVCAILTGVIERSVIADIHTAPSEQQATPTGMNIHPEFGWFSLYRQQQNLVNVDGIQYCSS